MDQDELIKFCLINKDAICDYPFKDRGCQNTPIIRNKINKKWFAIIFKLDEILYINLKCNPCDSWVLQDQYKYITPAWHMNKKHWIKVEVKKAPKSLLKTLIENSFNLIK